MSAAEQQNAASAVVQPGLCRLTEGPCHGRRCTSLALSVYVTRDFAYRLKKMCCINF